ncbi:hypothetical protein VTI74DRAFT_9485 [Chaetomium olivicolor]
MDPGAEVDNSDDIQAQVLQTTLDEIATSRQKGANSFSADNHIEPHDCCVICLDSISDACAALPCGHAHFDFLCLVSWLQEHPNCPLCKANVYKVRYADAQNADSFYRVPNAHRRRDSTGQDERASGQNTHTYVNRRFTSENGLLLDTGRRCPLSRSRRRDPPRPPPTESEAIQRRRHIYRHQLYSLHIGSNRISQYRQPPTPVQFSSTPHLVSRARLWIRRELQVFSFLSGGDPDPSANSPSATPPPTTTTTTTTTLNNGVTNHRTLRRRRNNAEFLLEYIIAILKTVDVQGSAGQAEAMLADFLGREHAPLFLHELRSWLRSPAGSLAEWDREVQYPDPDLATRGGKSGGGVGHGRGEEENEGEWTRGGGWSWRDREGDHWRADGGRDGEMSRKRKGRDVDELGQGRASRPRREPRG